MYLIKFMPKYKSTKDQLYVRGFFHEVWKLDVYVVMSKCKKRITDFLEVNNDGNTRFEFPSGHMGMYLLYRRNKQVIPCIVIPHEFDFNDWRDHAGLAHEATHAAVALHRIRGIYLPVCGHPPECHDDENLCYTIGWIMENCYKMIQNKDQHKFKFADETLVKK